MPKKYQYIKSKNISYVKRVIILNNISQYNISASCETLDEH